MPVLIRFALTSRFFATRRLSQISTFNLRAMSTTTVPNGDPRPQQAKKNNGGKKELKILMLHGFTQSGPLFHAKTRALEKLLTKTLAPLSLLPTLIYPTAPIRLLPSDIPGYQPPSDAQDDDQLPDTWAWFRRDDATGEYRNFDEGMTVVAQAIRDADGIDGVCGFSQGAAMAGFVAAALEPSRSVPEGPENEWARKLRDANCGQGVKFAVPWSGFVAPQDEFKWLYEPKITTPTLHYIGSLDTVVVESRSQGLVDRCEDPLVVVHPGGHHVPVAKEWVMPLVGFIRNHTKEEPTASL